MIDTYGKLTTLAGTPKRFTFPQADPAAPFPCHGVLAQAWHANTGRVFIGKAGMDKVTGVNVLATLAIPTANSIPSFSAALTLAPNAIKLGDLWFDVEVSDEGILLGLLIS